MDFPFMKQNDEDFGLREDLFENRLSKCSPEVMCDNWSSNTDGMLDSIFSMDFLNNFDVQQTNFGGLGDLSDHMKMEAEDYEITLPNIPEQILPEKDNGISSNSSDSGLSSDNLEVEMSPQYEPSLSPTPDTLLTNHNSIKRLSTEKKFSEYNEPLTKKICVKEQMPKVIVQKVPQVMMLSNKANTSSNTIQPPRQKHHVQEHQQTTFPQQSIMNGIRGSEIKIVKLAPHMFSNTTSKPVTIQVKNSNTGAKIQAKPGTFFLNKAKLTEMKRIVRVQNSNPRSVLIPVSLQDVKKLKAFKIMNPPNMRSVNHKVNDMIEVNNNIQLCGKQEILIDNKLAKACEDSFIDNSSDSESIIIEDGYDNEDYVHDPDAPYPKLILTAEEKRLLSKEGITLPSHYPLTKHEERELKRIRRKIRNKISAQDSRKRKKEYVDGLEERVKQCTEENQTLMKRIKQLQNQNQNLMSQMKKLQSLLTKGTNKTTQPTTCLMVLLLSLALVAAPNLKLGQNVKEGDLEEAVQETILQNRRNLLFNNKDQNTDIADEDINMSDIISAAEFNNERESNSAKILSGTKYASSTSCRNVKLNYPEFIDDVDDENWYLSSDKAKVSEDKIIKDSSRNLQTSGFNIEKSNKELIEQEELGQNTWLDKDVLDMVSPSINGLYALNMDKIGVGSFLNLPDTTVIDVTAKQMYASDNGINQNSSDMRQVNKY